MYNELHEVRDTKKLNHLIDSIKLNGWEGMPIVVMPEEIMEWQAVTGTHRLNAIRQIKKQTGEEVKFETIDLTEVLAESGISEDEIIDIWLEYEEKVQDQDWFDVVLQIIRPQISNNVCKKYGIEW